MRDVWKISSDVLEVDFAPKCGGSVRRLRYFNGTQWVDILRPASDTVGARVDPLLSSSFPLFPFSNRIALGRFSFGGNDFYIPANMPPEPHAIHGISWQKAAWVVEYSEDYIKLSHFQDDEHYPFHFSATQEWRIRASSLEVSLSILNIGKNPMPFGMGIHPYFVKTPDCCLRMTADFVMMNDLSMIPSSVERVPESWNFSKGARKISEVIADNCFLNWDGRCDIFWPELKSKVCMRADNVFQNTVLYVPENEPFFCFEPVTNMNDAHNNSLSLDKTGLSVLASGESLTGDLVMNFESSLEL